MKLEQAVELLQDSEFRMKGMFAPKLGGDVAAKYTSKKAAITDIEATLEPVDVEYNFKVVDAEILINDIGIDLDEITKEIDLYNEVADVLCNIIDVDSAGVERI